MARRAEFFVDGVEIDELVLVEFRAALWLAGCGAPKRRAAAREMRPDFTAACSASYAASGTGGISSASTPARTARTAASPGAKRTVIPPMSMASVTTRPWKCSSSRSNPVNTFSESVAGVLGSGSSAGIGKVAGHDAADSRGNRGAEGNQFEMLQAFFVGANHRKIDVRIRGRVAVARENVSRWPGRRFLPRRARKRRQIPQLSADLHRTSAY